MPMFTAEPHRRSHELAVLGGFVEVFLAKEGHDGLVGINFLDKIQLPTPATLYGALLAGVDYVLVGAGIPRDIPGLIDGLAAHEPVALPLHVTGGDGAARRLRFDPRRSCRRRHAPLARPRFLAIIASATLAISLARQAPGVDGFVVEGPTAGGHNAPPRGRRARGRASPSTDRATWWTSRRSARSVCPSGWRAGRRRPAAARGLEEAPPASRWGPCSRSARSRDGPRAPRTRDRAGPRRAVSRSSPTRSPRPPGSRSRSWSSRARCPSRRSSEARERRCDLGYLRDVFAGRRHDRLPLPGGAGRRLRAQGRQRRGHGRAASASATA